MRHIIFIFTASFFLISCGQNETKQKELELKEKELALKERELLLKEKENTHQQPTKENTDINYKSYKPCSFSVVLPSNLDLQPIYEDRNPNYCDFSVKSKDGFEFIQIHSLINSRFEFNSIVELYQSAINESDFDITYKIQKSNWFVLSGINRKNGNVIYWKRVSGNRFISDLYIEYPKSRELDIMPHITTISRSFASE